MSGWNPALAGVLCGALAAGPSAPAAASCAGGSCPARSAPSEGRLVGQLGGLDALSRAAAGSKAEGAHGLSDRAFSASSARGAGAVQVRGGPQSGGRPGLFPAGASGVAAAKKEPPPAGAGRAYAAKGGGPVAAMGKALSGPPAMAGGMVLGALIGFAVGGPIGAAVGLLAGAFAGALGGLLLGKLKK